MGTWKKHKCGDAFGIWTNARKIFTIQGEEFQIKKKLKKFQ